MKIKLTSNEIKGGMKFPISPDANLCKKESSGVDCALNVIDTLKSDGRFSDKWKLRVLVDYPKAVNDGTNDGMNDGITVELLKKLLPHQFKGKELFFRSIQVPPGKTIYDIIFQYWNRIQGTDSTKLEEREGLVLSFKQKYAGHIVVLALIDGSPHIIDQQVLESPMKLDSYCSNYIKGRGWNSIKILEDNIYNSELGDAFMGASDRDIVAIGRMPSENAYLHDDDIDFQDERTGNTALINATSRNNAANVDILLMYKANPDIQNKEGMTALAIACKNGYSDIASKLIIKEKANVNVQDKDGNTPLHLACRERNTKIVEMLVGDIAIDVNVQNKDGYTPLHLACLKNRKDIARILAVKAHANLNLLDKYSNTPLVIALVSGYRDILDMLIIEAHANVNLQDKDGFTLLHLACRYSLENTVMMLINEAHADVNIKDKSGMTPLDIAKKHNKKPKIIKLLEILTATKSSSSKRAKSPSVKRAKSYSPKVTRRTPSKTRTKKAHSKGGKKTSQHFLTNLTWRHRS